ncbi:MAG: glycine-rich domain-containing protein [Candidatus Thorarchaeota archaeon]
MSALEKDHILEQARYLIYNQDMSAIIYRLTHVNGWSSDEAIEATNQYRNYLYLAKKYKDSYTLPPSKDIDDVWHAHILHTKDYIKFCNEVFGEYLHHTPGTGEVQDKNNNKFPNLFEQTQELYKREFGDYIYSVRDKPLILRVQQYFVKSKKSHDI